MLSTHRFVQHRARAIVALLALAVVALVLAACGGSGGDSSSGGSSADAETLLRQTFTGTHEIRSGRADIQLRVLATGSSSLRGPIELGITGPFQSNGSGQLPSFDLALDIKAQGQGFQAGLTSTSDKLFVKVSGTSYEVPAQLIDQIRQSYARSQQQGSTQQRMSLQSLGLDPLSWLQDPTVEGTETIGGAQTDHISATLDVNALLDDLDKVLARVSAQGLAGAAGGQVPSRIPPDVRSKIVAAVKTAKIDVWSGKDDHTLRKLTLELNVAPPAGSGLPRTLDISLSIALSDLNQPQTITAPATSRPLNELLGQFQGLLGGALGGGALGGGSGSAGSAGGATSQQLNAYSQCIQRAGSNVSDAQKCASLLTK